MWNLDAGEDSNAQHRGFLIVGACFLLDPFSFQNEH